MALCVVTNAGQTCPESGQQASWRYRVGPMLRQVSEPDFKVGSAASAMVLPPVFGIEVPFSAPLSVGDAFAFADRTYDDGFVNAEAGTVATGLTAAWGYDANSQYSGGAGGVLTMSVAPTSGLANSARLLSSNSDYRRVSEGGGDDYEGAIHMEIDRLVSIAEGFKMGPVFGFSLFNGGGNSGSVNAFSGSTRADDYAVGVTDSYQLSGGVVPPLAPYANPGGGLGTLLPNTPASRTLNPLLTASTSADFQAVSAMSFSYTSITMDAGWRAEWQNKECYFASLSAGGSLNLLDWHGAHRESASQSVNGAAATSYASMVDKSDGVDLLLGLYVQAGVGMKMTERTLLSGFFRYDFTEELNKDIGPSRVEQNLSGWSFGLGVTQDF